MRFGVIVISQDGNLFARTGSVSRHTAMLDPGDYNNNTPASYLDVSCLIAKTRKTAVFEVSLPAPLSGQNLIQAIRFELENNIPFPLEKVYWGFRKLSKDDRSYRIFAVLKSEVDSLYPKVKEAGLSCDYFIPSQLLQETLPDDSTDNVPAAKKESADLDDNPLQLFLSAISIDPSLKNIHLHGCPVPFELQPVRYKKWKVFYRVSLLICLMAVLWISIERYQTFSSDFQRLQEKNNELNEKLREARNIQKTLMESREL